MIDCDAFKVPLLKALLAEMRQNDAIRLDRILPTLPSLEDPNFIEAFREYSRSAPWTQFIKKQVHNSPIIHRAMIDCLFLTSALTRTSLHRPRCTSIDTAACVLAKYSNAEIIARFRCIHWPAMRSRQKLHHLGTKWLCFSLLHHPGLFLFPPRSNVCRSILVRLRIVHYFAAPFICTSTTVQYILIRINCFIW